MPAGQPAGMGGRGVRAGRWPAYRTLWIFLLLGWTVSAADTWMIENKVAFLADADKPFALCGLIGGLFFAGYMLTQFPGGWLGDRYGHRTIIVISLVWRVWRRWSFSFWSVAIVAEAAPTSPCGAGSGASRS